MKIRQSEVSRGGKGKAEQTVGMYDGGPGKVGSQSSK